MNKKRLGEHLEKLATFRLVAELKSVHKASSRLGLSQPAVSRTIKVLEDVLECRLMERKSNGIQLTPDGTRLYEYALIIAQTLEGFDPSEEGTAKDNRPFRIATYDNIACGVLSKLGSVLTAEFPRLAISIGGPNSRILDNLINGRSDCALIAQPRVLPGLEYKKVFTERYGLFVSRKLFAKTPLKRKTPLRLEDLKEIKLIAMPDAIAGANKNIDRLLWEIGLESVISIDSYEVAVHLVLDGHGVGIMPSSSAAWAVRDGLLQELSVKEVPASMGQHDLTLCWNKNEKHPKVAVLEKLLSEKYSKI